jgi:nucleotide-binding universal stress UspA family protein
LPTFPIGGNGARSGDREACTATDRRRRAADPLHENPTEADEGMSEPDPGVILVAVDGSQSSMTAAGVGARLAKMLGSRLGLVHVLDVPPLNFWAGIEDRMKDDIRADAERMLSDTARRIADACGLAPSFYIVEGPPDEELCRLAREKSNVLMVIIGRGGIAAEKRLRLGRSQSGGLVAELVNRLPVPLLVIPPDIDALHICPHLGTLSARDQDPGHTEGQGPGKNGWSP